MYCTPLHASQYYTEECEFSIIMFPKFRECLERPVSYTHLTLPTKA